LRPKYSNLQCVDALGAMGALKDLKSPRTLHKTHCRLRIFTHLLDNIDNVEIDSLSIIIDII